MRRVFAWVWILVFAAVPSWASPRMGVASLASDGTTCLSLRGGPPHAGDPFWLVLFDPPRIVDGVVIAAKACSLSANLDSPTYLGRARFAFGTDPEWGIAVFAPGSRAEYVAGEFILKTPDAATPLSFRTCASQEGVHFTTWRGNRRTWHEYVYLGIDLEATCTDKDVGE